MNNQIELNTHGATLPYSPQEKETIQSDQSIQTLEKQKILLKKNPIVFKIQKIFANTRLAFDDFMGISFQPSQIEYTKNHLEDALALTHYLETNVMDVKDSAKKTEKPYKASLSDLVRFSQLVGNKNDPVEIIERLKHIGMIYTVSDLLFRIDVLRELTDSPTSIKGLSLIAQNNMIKKLFFRQYGRDKSELNTNNMHIYSNFEWDFITNENLDKQIASINNDQHALTLLQLKEQEFRPYMGYSGKVCLENISLLQQHNLIKDLLKVENAGLTMYDFHRLGSSTDFYRPATEQLVKQSMELWKIHIDNDYSPEEFIKKLSSIRSFSLLPKELAIYKPFIDTPRESAIVMNMFKDLGYNLCESISRSYLLISYAHYLKKDEGLTDSNIHETYKNALIQQTCMNFLYEGDVAHEVLEKIKEKNWITIQTYNRLYAARRKNTGYESYAYRPKKGNTHPVINVSFYKDERPASMDHYKKNYQLYEKRMEKIEKNKDAFIKNFKSWYDEPKKYPGDPELALVVNYTLPIGISANGHTHYYATPYGIVSGCIAENRKEELVEKDFVSSIGTLGIQLVSGHKEMLADFLRSQGALEKAKTEYITPENAVTIDFDTISFPSELKEMILPSHITVAEALLNLHLEQYLHPITPDEQLLITLMKNIGEGKIQLIADDTIVNINTILERGQKILLKKKS